MISRRSFMTALSAFPVSRLLGSRALAAVVHPALPTSAEVSSAAEDMTQYVKIAIGTGGHGHTYPGATVPFGMVQLSPDTYNDGWDWCSGYHYSDSSIMGFSHTHLSGTGASDMLDFLLMPGTGPAKTVPGLRQNPGEGYRSRFSHEEETAEPGYYSVRLRDYDIRAELSATERAGIHRYTFPKSDSSHFILDLLHSFGNTPVLWANLKIVGQDTIMGGRSMKGWAPGREIYFAMQFSKPFASSEIVSEEKHLDETVREAKGTSLKCLAHFKTTESEVILVKTGLSGVSAEAAQKNLEAEIPGWDFAKVRRDAHAAWSKNLLRIKITTSNARHKRIFYTGLYHMMVAPTLFDDVDGQYRGMDSQVHQLPAGLHNYSTFSLWDTYRAAHPMYTLCLADRVPDFVNCLVRMAQQSPDGVPVWPLQAKETGCMTGYHSSSVVAEAHTKGFKGIDFNQAYAPFKKRAMEDDYRGLGYYRKLGYIPCEQEEESVARRWNTPMTIGLWLTSRGLRAISMALNFWSNARGITRIFSMPAPVSCGRDWRMGRWSEPFNPIEMGHSKKWRDYTESDPWETTFTVQHDPAGLIKTMGGPQAFVEKLDELFTTSSQLPADAPPDIAGMIGQYAHGNEPCHHMAYLYSYAGAAHKTQDRVRKLLDLEYDDQPDGLAGNEDAGKCPRGSNT